MEYDEYRLYLQRCNGYWERETYPTLEDIQYVIDTLDEEEYWWYIVVGASKQKGDTTIAGGKVHTKQEYKTYKRKR